MELSKDFSPTTYPIIRIKHGRFLDPVFEAYIKTKPKWEKWIKPEEKEIKKLIEINSAAWKEKEEIIIKTMCEAMSLNFLQNIIDVYVVCGNDRQFSDPIVIRTYSQSKKFIDDLAHELTHRLMSDNIQCFGKTRMGEIMKKTFPEESGNVRSHIQTYALLKHIFVDVLKDKNWEKRILERVAKSSHPQYKKAWDIVEKIGHMKVVTMIRKEREKSLG
ncbi:MAG: hypothetical protein PHC82_03170 [Candidatus Pacebacteria bacterium]|nr:hypothetical protein [Candidatus Paceibacterota bacterium]